MKVLVATDGSQDSMEAGEFVGKMVAEDPALEIHLIFVMDPNIGLVGPEAFGVIPHLNEMLIGEAERALDGTEQFLAAAGVKVASKRSEWGDPADTICDVADKGDIDLVVIGSRGMGQLTGLLLGSVSSRVAARCSKPVLVVR